MFADLTLLSSAIAFFALGVNGAPGDIVCRYETTTLAEVNYYTCTELALKYSITVEKFFQLNPSVDKNCDTIQPRTNYCVAGWLELPVAGDGFCGPQHNNATCLGLDKQCCNAATWKCGDQIEDCQAGTCFSGACEGFPDQYAMDGKCGIQHNGLLCGGKWGTCCDIAGKCGTGESFCGTGKCQNGNCTIIIPPPPAGGSGVSTPVALPSSTPTSGSVSPNGSCGGTSKFVCKGSTFGDCCSSAGFCGSTTGHCQAGCQTSFGTCTKTGLSPDGTCGGANKYQCKGSVYGDCCSPSAYCGSTTGHCTAGCQAEFGTCTSTNISPDGTCGGTKGYLCKGSTFGDCCGQSGYCGSTTGHCTAGCQTAFGTCTSTDLSPDGTCGGTKNYKCRGSSYGDCCSPSGYCGKSTDHCGAGCQSGFGTCSTVVTSSKAPIPTGVSKDGTCGGTKGLKCQGSTFGNCCSVTGICGSTVNHCAQGCQKSFSSACLTTNIPSLDGACGASKGFTCVSGPFNTQCCSSGGFCGTTDDHCKTGCQKNYGTCK